MTAGRVARLAAAVCAALAAAPAAGQDSLRDGLDRMAQDIASLLKGEADRTGDPLRVSFRPARTGPQQIDVYCGPLSFGLRNALHERVQSLRDRMNLPFDVAVADERAHVPPEVTMSWTWDGEESIEVETHVWLTGSRSQRYSATLDVAGLNGAQRECLFTFRPGGGVTEAREAGFLHEEPTFDVRRIVHRFSAGDKLDVLGVLSPEGGNGAVWSVVVWDDPETRTWRTLFTAGLADDGDDAAFEEARREDTVAAYEAYLRDYPSGAHASEARRLLEAARAPAIGVGDVFRDCDHCPEMVVVPSGSFTMGSPSSEAGRGDDEGPVHRVRIGSPFAVGVHEVTRGEFGRFVSATGRSTGDSCWVYEDGGWESRSGLGWRSPGFSQTDSHPVVCVSWEDAQAYVSWLSRETGESYRLLSESEWEYVARAGTSTSRYWGDSSSSQCRYANGADLAAKRHESGWTVADCDDGYYRTSPVGSFGANAFGLHDVLGNVLEWVQDCWNGSYAGAPGDGSAWESGECSRRVLRGGSWLYYPRFLRSAFRGRLDAGSRYFYLGFRVARTFTP